VTSRVQEEDAHSPAPPMPAPDLLAQALEKRAFGDDDGAAVAFEAVLEQHPDAPEARQAYYYLAESFARRGRWNSARAAFQAFLEQPGQDEYSARALFWLARCHEEMGDWASAAATYERYRALETPLEPYAAMRQAAQYQALGQPAEAAQAYAHAGAADVQRGERAGSYEKAIALYRELGRDDEALRLYRALLEFASLPTYRARILSEAAALARQQGQPEQADTWLREIVTVAPATAQAVNAVQQLSAAGDPALDAADAAMVYFLTENYSAALPMFDAAVSQAPPGSEQALDLQRLRGLTRRALGDFAAALDELAAVANSAPADSQAGRQARLDWIQTLGQSGEVEQAAQKYLEYAQTYRDDWRAPVAMDRAAQLYDRLGKTDEARQVRLELGQRHPDSDLAAPGLNHAAWYHYGQGQLEQAGNIWQELARSQQGYEKARGAFWAARIAQRQNDDAQARSLFQTAREAAPNSYYGARATEELGIIPPEGVPLTAPIPEQDWHALADWVAGWHAPPDEQHDYQAALSSIASSGFVQRAVALQHVGLRVEAIGEWNDARDMWAEEPYKLMLLARQAHEHRVPYIGLKAAEQVRALAPQEALPPPLALQRLIFPTPYAPLIEAEARARGIDPRLFYALLRQESLFNPGATSWVGARGLAQVMPSTGQGIAQNLGMADFQLDDLYRPQVSVRFGSYYISERIADMGGSVQGGLAAYNGGLGNAIRWADGYEVSDPDLFTESIDFPETQGYVKRVYGFYGAYQHLYSVEP
jgi:soluble lytic murein transglycosylase